MAIRVVAAVALVISTGLAAAQSRLTFEAASVKPVVAPDGMTVDGDRILVRKGSGAAVPRNTGGPGTADPSRIHYPLISLKALLSQAFDSYAEIAGPGWLSTQLVQVDATLPPDTTKEQFREMLTNLIVDRFQLKYHSESKEITGYALVVAKNGLKLKESVELPASNDSAGDPQERPPIGPDGFPIRSRLEPGKAGLAMYMGQRGRRRVYGQQQTTHELADFLGRMLFQDAGPDSPRVTVVDATGLTGKYDFELTFSRSGSVEADAFPELFGALQSQLGLKLEPKKIPTRVLAIDHMERTPTGN